MIIKTNKSQKIVIWLSVVSLLLFDSKPYASSVVLPELPLSALFFRQLNTAPGAGLASRNSQRCHKIGGISPQQYMTEPDGAAASKNSQAASTSGTKTETSQSPPNQYKKSSTTLFNTTKNTLLDSLSVIGEILKREPRLMLVLVWDIDGTILYHPSDWGDEATGYEVFFETMLSSLIANSFESWRRNGQLLLILNTARHYDEYNFFDPSLYLPRADFIITDGGDRYFVNNTLATGFSHETSKPVNSCPGAVRARINLPAMVPPSCIRIIGTSTMEARCPQAIAAESIIQSFESTNASSQGIRLWHQSASTADMSHIVFAHHLHINKGAAFARLIQDMTKQNTDFKDKTKWVATAGDGLMDTAMMNERMDYPFRNRQPTPLSPGLPANTTYIGTVLSKAGYLQDVRFKSLFNKQTTVHSKAKSIAGIVEGTAQLLKRQLLRLSMPAR